MACNVSIPFVHLRPVFSSARFLIENVDKKIQLRFKKKSTFNISTRNCLFVNVAISKLTYLPRNMEHQFYWHEFLDKGITYFIYSLILKNKRSSLKIIMIKGCKIILF